MSSIPGQGRITLASNAKIIVIPTCGRCGQLVSQCPCGRPTRAKA